VRRVYSSDAMPVIYMARFFVPFSTAHGISVWPWDPPSIKRPVNHEV
jgi:hypothetical protein